MKTIIISSKTKDRIQFLLNLIHFITISLFLIYLTYTGYLSDVFPNGYLLFGITGFIILWLEIGYIIWFLLTKYIEIKIKERKEEVST